MVRKKGAVLVCLLALSMLVAMPQAHATYDRGQPQADHDFAVGGGQHVGALNEGFSAQSGPAGEDPSGHVSATFAPGGGQPLELKGPVICLHVIGNHAFIRFVAEKSDVPGFTEGQEQLLHVVDNGPQGAPTDLIANIPGFFAPQLPGFPCGVNFFAVPLEKGNITVNDAP